MKKISFIIPVFNEQKSLPELFSQILAIFSGKLKRYDYEIIFINDGSTDDSLKIIKNFKKNNSKIVIISFRKNLGKATALNEGFKKVKGDIVVTMDADLQDDPKNLPLLIDQLNKGFDFVVGWKKERFDPLDKILPSKIFNFFVRKISHISLHDFNSGFRIMKKEVSDELYLYGELHRFIPVIAVQRGFKVTEIPIIHNRRKFGKSKYGWERLLRGFFDFLTVSFLGSYGQKPLHFFGLVGIAGIIVGLIFSIYLTYLHFYGEKIGDRPLLTFAVLLIISGLQLISLGLLADILVRNGSKIHEKLPIDYED